MPNKPMLPTVCTSIRRQRTAPTVATEQADVRRGELMMVIAIVGNPSSGKRTLATALCVHRTLKMLGHHEVGAWISTAATKLVEGGNVLSDQLFGTLLAEAVGERDAVIVGRPRMIDELRAFLLNCPSPLFVVHLRASEALIDARRTAVGLPSIEIEHPGALQRLHRELAPVLAVAQESKRLLELDANLPLTELLERVDRFLDATS